MRGIAIFEIGRMRLFNRHAYAPRRVSSCYGINRRISARIGKAASRRYHTAAILKYRRKCHKYAAEAAPPPMPPITAQAAHFADVSYAPHLLFIK